MQNLLKFLRWWFGYSSEWTATLTLFRKQSISGKRIESPHCMCRYVNGELQYREMTDEEAHEDACQRA